MCHSSLQTNLPVHQSPWHNQGYIICCCVHHCPMQELATVQDIPKRPVRSNTGSELWQNNITGVEVQVTEWLNFPTVRKKASDSVGHLHDTVRITLHNISVKAHYTVSHMLLCVRSRQCLNTDPSFLPNYLHPEKELISRNSSLRQVPIPLGSCVQHLVMATNCMGISLTTQWQDAIWCHYQFWTTMDTITVLSDWSPL
jgi:hypothetical protein